MEKMSAKHWLEGNRQNLKVVILGPTADGWL